MLQEKAIADIELGSKKESYRIEAVALILEMADTHDDEGRGSNIQLINAQMKLKELFSSCNEVLTNYLLILEKKGFIGRNQHFSDKPFVIA